MFERITNFRKGTGMSVDKKHKQQQQADGLQYGRFPIPPNFDHFICVPLTRGESSLPKMPGVYFVSDYLGALAYVGQSENIRDRAYVGVHPNIFNSDKVGFYLIDGVELNYAESFYIGVYRPYRNFGFLKKSLNLNNNGGHFFSATEAGVKLGINARQVSNMASQGRIECKIINNQRRYTQQHIDNYLNRTKDLFTLAEVVNKTGIGATAIKHDADKGKINYISEGRNKRYTQQHIDDYITQRKETYPDYQPPTQETP